MDGDLRTIDQWTKEAIIEKMRNEEIPEEKISVVRQNLISEIRSIALKRYDSKDGRKVLYSLDIDLLRSLSQEDIDRTFPVNNTFELWEAECLSTEDVNEYRPGIVVKKNDRIILPGGDECNLDDSRIRLLHRSDLNMFE